MFDLDPDTFEHNPDDMDRDKLFQVLEKAYEDFDYYKSMPDKYCYEFALYALSNFQYERMKLEERLEEIKVKQREYYTAYRDLKSTMKEMYNVQ